MNEFNSNKMKINFVKFMIFNRLQKSQLIWTNSKLRKKVMSKVDGPLNGPFDGPLSAPEYNESSNEWWPFLSKWTVHDDSGRFMTIVNGPLSQSEPFVFEAVHFRKRLCGGLVQFHDRPLSDFLLWTWSFWSIHFCSVRRTLISPNWVFGSF